MNIELVTTTIAKNMSKAGLFTNLRRRCRCSSQKLICCFLLPESCHVYDGVCLEPCQIDSIPKIADYSSEMIWDGHLVVAGGKTVLENQTSSAIDATSHFFCIQLSVLLTKPVQYMLMISKLKPTIFWWKCLKAWMSWLRCNKFFVGRKIPIVFSVFSHLWYPSLAFFSDLGTWVFASSLHVFTASDTYRFGINEGGESFQHVNPFCFNKGANKSWIFTSFQLPCTHLRTRIKQISWFI